MGFDFAGGMAAASGYQQGVDDQVARNNALEDRAYARTQRDFQQQTQQRQQQQWGREDDTRSQMSQIDQSAPQDVQLRQAAAAYQQTDPQKWLELHQQADKAMWDRSARQMQGLLGSADSLDAGQIADQASQIWNNANMPVKITNPQYDKTSGQVTVDVTSRDTGVTTQKVYKDKNELLTALRAQTDPATYAAIQQKTLDEALKARAEQAKPMIIPAGGAIAVNGKITATNDNGMVQVGTNADGTPILARATARIGPDGQPIAGGAGGSGGAGVGKGAGAPKTSLEDVQGILDKVAAKDDAPTQLRARSFAQAVTQANPGLPAQTAAQVAYEAAANPAATRPDINTMTGAIDRTYVNPDINGGQPIRVAAGSFKPADLKALPDQEQRRLTAQVQAMAQTWSPPLRDAIMAAAKDPNQMAALEGKVTAASQGSSQQVLQQNLAAARNKVALAKTFLVQNKGLLDRISDAVTGGGNAPSTATASATSTGSTTAAGTAPPTSTGPGLIPQPAGLGVAAAYGSTSDAVRTSPAVRYIVQGAAHRAQAQQRTDAKAARDQEQASAQAKAQQQMSSQFQQDTRTMKPEDLVRKYDALRSSLPQADRVTLKLIEQKI